MSTQNIQLRDQPAYGLAEAARYLKLPAATLRSWVIGRAYPRGRSTATFQALIKPARKQPPLLSFYNLSASGQLAMRRLLAEHLKRVEWDQWKFPVRLYPYVSAEPTTARPIAIDPSIAFGRPVVLRMGVATEVIALRIDAGESVAALAEGYDLRPEEIEEAVLYERAA